MIVAPDQNNSAVSHKTTMKCPMRLVKCGEGVYSLAGTPADCVLVALFHLHLRPDLILSGINEGANVGSDLFYSGTVAAAEEGAQNGFAAIALSLYLRSSSDQRAEGFLRAAEMTTARLAEWKKLAEETGFLNVNFPNCTPRGIQFCRQARKNYHTAYLETEGGLQMDLNTSSTCESEGDVSLLKAGFVTVTPISLDRTDDRALKIWERKE